MLGNHQSDSDNSTFIIYHSTFPMPLHAERGSPCAERIEKTLTHRKLIPLQGFYDGMSKIGSRCPDAEMNPLRQLRPGGQERNIFPGRDLIRLRHIPAMIPRQDKQVARAKLFQQPGKPSIKILESGG
jgi:hypothetical protein